METISERKAVSGTATKVLLSDILSSVLQQGDPAGSFRQKHITHPS